MKALAWYTVIFNALVIILFILTAMGAVAKPPFTALEDILWAIFTVPVLLLGIKVVRRKLS